MLQVSTKKLREADICELAKLVYESRQASALRSDDRTIAKIEKTLSDTATEDNTIVIPAREDRTRELLGSLAST